MPRRLFTVRCPSPRAASSLRNLTKSALVSSAMGASASSFRLSVRQERACRFSVSDKSAPICFRVPFPSVTPPTKSFRNALAPGAMPATAG